MINKTTAILVLLAASAAADDCLPEYQCTLYNLEDFDEDNGSYSFCLSQSIHGEYPDSVAYSFIPESFGNFDPTELASYKCGAMVAIDFCASVPYHTPDPDAEYAWRCIDNSLLFSSDGFGKEAASTPDNAVGALESIVMYGSKDPPPPPTQSCRPTLYTNGGCD